MNIYFVGAGALALIGTVIHVVAGAKGLVPVFLNSEELNRRVKTVLHACWHAVSILLFMLALGFLLAGTMPGLVLLGTAATVLTLAMGVCTAGMVIHHRQKAGDFWPWGLFWVMTALGAAGACAG